MTKKELKMMPDSKGVKTFSYYKHHKGDLYLAETLAYRESDVETVIVYMQCKTGIRFVRPLSEFIEKFELVETND